MSTLVLGWPIYSDVGVLYTPALSGGSWAAALPLTNLQDRQLGVLARSSDATTASTQFETDLGVARSVRVVALPVHNFSSAATVRIRSSNSAGSFGSPIYDSGSLAGWPSGLTAEDVEGINVGFVHVLPAGTTAARYWLIEVTDTGNADGYVELGRLVIAGGVEPSHNMSVGASLGWEDTSSVDEGGGGARIYNEQPRRRTFRFVLDDIEEDESFGTLFELLRRAGTTGQLMVVSNPADSTHLHRRAFLGVMRELSPIEYPYATRYRAAFHLVEEL